MTHGHGPRFFLMCVSLVSIVAGGGGFFCPELFGTYLSPARCGLILIHSALCLGTVYLACHWVLRGVCLATAALLGGLAWIGYTRGASAILSTGPQISDPGLLVLLNGRIELGHNDHRLHLLVAGIYLVIAILPGSWDRSLN